MKRILTIILCVILAIPVANAQIQIKQKTKLPTKVATISMYWYELYKLGDKYQLTLKSTNQYDDHYVLYIGNKEEAIATLNTFIEMCDTMSKDESVEIDNGNGEIYIVQKYEKGLSFQQKNPGKAGFTYMYKMYFKKTLDIMRKE